MKKLEKKCESEISSAKKSANTVVKKITKKCESDIISIKKSAKIAAQRAADDKLARTQQTRQALHSERARASKKVAEVASTISKEKLKRKALDVKTTELTKKLR